ncbi:tetratricopeptide repeat-containing protein, partial [bacterium]|nr:tetratricopeptide repeat-containing protein [bacterium]
MPRFREKYFQALESRAFLYFIQGKIDYSLTDIHRLKANLSKGKTGIDNIIGIADIESLEAMILGMTGKFDEAEKIFINNYHVGKKYHKYELLISSLLSLAQVHGVKGDNKLVLEQLEKAEFFLDYVPILKSAEFYNNLANIYHNMGRFDDALKFYKTSLNFCEEYAFLFLKTQVLNNIAFLYDDLNKNLTAKNYYLKNINLRKKIGYMEGLIISYINYGVFL